MLCGFRSLFSLESCNLEGGCSLNELSSTYTSYKLLIDGFQSQAEWHLNCIWARNLQVIGYGASISFDETLAYRISSTARMVKRNWADLVLQNPCLGVSYVSPEFARLWPQVHSSVKCLWWQWLTLSGKWCPCSSTGVLCLPAPTHHMRRTKYLAYVSRWPLIMHIDFRRSSQVEKLKPLRCKLLSDKKSVGNSPRMLSRSTAFFFLSKSRAKNIMLYEVYCCRDTSYRTCGWGVMPFWRLPEKRIEYSSQDSPATCNIFFAIR